MIVTCLITLTLSNLGLLTLFILYRHYIDKEVYKIEKQKRNRF